MAEQTHTGGCHCGAVRFSMKMDTEQPALVCDCSHCRMKGLMLAFGPFDAFSLDEGQGEIATYRFNTGKIAHQFCKTCGVEAFGHGEGPGGSEMAAINLRCLDGVDFLALKIQEHHDEDSKFGQPSPGRA